MTKENEVVTLEFECGTIVTFKGKNAEQLAANYENLLNFARCV